MRRVARFMSFRPGTEIPTSEMLAESNGGHNGTLVPALADSPLAWGTGNGRMRPEMWTKAMSRQVSLPGTACCAPTKATAKGDDEERSFGRKRPSG